MSLEAPHAKCAAKPRRGAVVEPGRTNGTKVCSRGISKAGGIAFGACQALLLGGMRVDCGRSEIFRGQEEVPYRSHKLWKCHSCPASIVGHFMRI